MNKFFIPAIVLFAITSCDSAKEVVAEIEPEVAPAQEISTKDLSTITPSYMNTKIRPQDDFFAFANGTWTATNPVPKSESSWGSFNELERVNNKKLTLILEEFKGLADSYPQGSLQQILGDYYSSYTNMERRNELGIKAIEDQLNAIERLNSKKGLPDLIAKQHILGIDVLFQFGVGQDLKDVEHHSVNFFQGGIGLPNKDYYSAEDKKEILMSYQDHMARMFELAGRSQEETTRMIPRIIEFETALASNMMAPSELRIPEKTYNKMDRYEFIKPVDNFDFDSYFSAVGIDSFDTLVVGQVNYAEAISKLVKDYDLEAWKNYLYWKVLDHYAGHLSDEFVEQNFNFYGEVLSGRTTMKPINERAIREITGMEFNELLGKAFVGRHYSDVAQARVNTMIDNLLLVFQERISNLEWMSDETKKEAQEKLSAIGRKIGFPSKWEDFSSLAFSADTYIENIDATARFSHQKNIGKLHKTVDKDEWGMPAHMINAYYHPLMNEIAFPAGIMQPPFFSVEFEDAVNYGRIGMVIGHEFTHGFDDMGSKFAADGTFNNWWSVEDRTSFEERTSKLGKTYAGFCPIEDNCVNPDLTMGENIADLGGLTLAYHAYTRTEEFKKGLQREGFTPAQRFFIAYAQLWKINYTTAELKNRIENDYHSPGMFRVNGPLMNCPEFFEAFDVQEMDAMRNSAEKIAKIW